MRNKTLKISALILCLFLMVFAVTACAQLTGGVDGTDGSNGAAGVSGNDGKSAYELAVENGYKGTLDEWISSLSGKDGKSAYELAVENGYTGTELEWLSSLVGDCGQDGKSAYELAVENGYTGTEDEWLISLIGARGQDGKSAYELAVENGFEGSVSEWLESLIGERGIAGIHIAIDGSVTVTLTDGSQYTVEVTESTCKHTGGVSTVVSPTCAERGYTIFTCPDCSYIEHNTYTEAIGHHFYERYCVHCGVEESFGTISTDVEWYASSLSEFTLTTKEQLAGLAYLVNIDGINFSGKTIYLGNDVDLSSCEWEPIGNASTAFAGNFNGKGFTVSNLKISEKTEYVGLFGNSSGQLVNLNVNAASISVSGDGQYVGIAVGYKSGLEMQNISVSGYVDAPGSTYVGGVCGYVHVGGGNRTCQDISNSADISGCSYVGGLFGSIFYNGSYSSGTFTVTISGFSNNGSVASSADYAGGIAGQIYLEDTYSYSSSKYGVYRSDMSNVSNSGDISGANYVGGFFGSSSFEGSSTLVDSSNTGDITSSGYRVGGISGYMYNEAFTNVTNSADISGVAYVGGLVGEGCVSFADCSNAGSSVEASGYYAIESTFYAYLGGYIGSGTCYSITNCENTVTLNYTDKGMYVGGFGGYVSPGGGSRTYQNVTNSADISGYSYVGGLFGSFMYIGSYSSGTYTVTFADCSNSGNVASVTDYAGGIIGQISLDDTYHYSSSKYGVYRSAMSNVSNSGDISGVNYVGGFFGSSSFEGSSTLVDSSNTGDITSSGYRVGGISGYMYNEALTNVTSSADISGVAYVGGLVGEGCVSFADCSNAGSSVEASGYYAIESTFYAYLGGYIGSGTCYSITNCENTVTLNYTDKGMYVGGFGGYVSPGGGSRTYQNVTNSADISGYSYVGGLFGSFMYIGSYSSGTHTVTFADCSNSGNVASVTDYAGGITGQISLDDTYHYSSSTYGVYRSAMSNVSNSGDISGVNYVGGFFGSSSFEGSSTLVDSSNTGDITSSGYRVGGISGYMYNEAFTNVTSSADISGVAYVGGLIGEGCVSFADCSNAGSCITATGYCVIDTAFYAYLGGYIGSGTCYSITNCENTVALNYTDKGMYVGGFGGYVSPGGGSRTYQNVTNSADISGYSYVGGLFGSFMYNGSYSSGTHNIAMTDISNSGNVTSTTNHAGGIAGRFYIIDGYYYSSSSQGYYKATFIEIHNTADVVGVSYVGGWFGEFYSESASTMVDSSVAGEVSGSEYTDAQIGSSYNLTITENT